MGSLSSVIPSLQAAKEGIIQWQRILQSTVNIMYMGRSSLSAIQNAQLTSIRLHSGPSLSIHFELEILTNKIQAISVDLYQNLHSTHVVIVLQMKTKSPLTSNDDYVTILARNSEGGGLLVAKKTESDESESICLRNARKKRIFKKPESLLGRLKLESPLSFSSVHNIFNILPINESALRSPDSEESYFKTMFYMRAVERAQLRRHALILQLRPTEKALQPIQYIINRYKSFGDCKFYQIAMALERTAAKLHHQQSDGFTQKLMRSFDGEPLSRFIDSMAGEIYMCKVAPNKLVISRPLLELLGEDPEAYAIELCKYKAPLREVISADLYAEVITKSIENIGLLSEYMAGQLTHDQLHAKSSVNFDDYIFDRHNKRIHCNFVLFMPTPQMSCIQMREIIKETNYAGPKCPNARRKRQLVDQHCQQQRFKEAEVLKNITKLPEGMLKGNERRLAGYKDIPQ